jgi:hypothetical protein
MKNKLLVLLAVISLSLTSLGQTNERVSMTFGYGAPFISGAKMFYDNEFKDMGNDMYASYGEESITYTFNSKAFGALHADLEFALSDKVGLGLSINYASWGFSTKMEETYPNYNYWTNTYTIETNTYLNDLTFTTVSIMPRLNIHFKKTEKIDVYWGIGAGYKSYKARYVSTVNSYYGSYRSEMNLSQSELQMGAESFGEFFSYLPVAFETTFGVKYYFHPNVGVYTEIGPAKSLIQAGLAIKV